MKRAKVLTVFAAVGLMAGVASPAHAAPRQNAAAQRTIAGAATEAHSWPMEQLVPLSVREAWHLSGRNEATFFEMVRQLTELSAQKRGITLPDDKESGAKAGEWIKKEAREDPDQLLYVIVDRAVQHSARTGTATTK